MPNLSDVMEWVVKRISALTRTATDANLTDGEYMAVDDASAYTRKITVANFAKWVMGKIKNLSITITTFRSGDVIPVDGPNGPAKMPTSNLQDAILGGPIDEAVQSWLDAHPEATTTVENHSLTYQKLVNGTLGFVTPEMFGAVGDGVTDDTSAIQATLDFGGVIIFRNKTYMVNAVTRLKVSSNSTLLLQKNTVLKAITNASTSYVILQLHYVENVTILGGKLIGDWDTHGESVGQAGHGIKIKKSHNVLISGVEITNCNGDCIYINGHDQLSADSDLSSNIVVQDCNLHHVKRCGIAVGGCIGFWSKHNYIHDIHGTSLNYSIDFESTNSLYHNKDCYIEGGELNDTVSVGAYTSNLNISSTYIGLLRISDNPQNVKITNAVLGYFRVQTIKDASKTFGVLFSNSLVHSGEIFHDSFVVTFDNCTFEPGADGLTSIKFLRGLVDSESSAKVSFKNCTFDTGNKVITSDSDGLLYPYAVPRTLELCNNSFYIRNSANITARAYNNIIVCNNVMLFDYTINSPDSAIQVMCNFQCRAAEGSITVVDNLIDASRVNRYAKQQLIRCYSPTVKFIGNKVLCTVKLSTNLIDMTSDANTGTAKIIGNIFQNYVSSDIKKSDSMSMTETSNVYYT